MNQSQFHEDHLPQPNPYLERLYPYVGPKPRFLMSIWRSDFYKHTYCLLGPLNATARSMNINRVIEQPKHIYS